MPNKFLVLLSKKILQYVVSLYNLSDIDLKLHFTKQVPLNTITLKLCLIIKI